MSKNYDVYALFIGDEELGRRISDYHFFSYNTSEALLMSPEQRQSIVGILAEKQLGAAAVKHTV
ncbi:MAG: hypothetical protein IJ659_03630 [Alloprevotella sp.]|nr:hypothetical protein [Alloprevotella sp.]